MEDAGELHKVHKDVFVSLDVLFFKISVGY
jgi:hypothetical protein